MSGVTIVSLMLLCVRLTNLFALPSSASIEERIGLVWSARSLPRGSIVLAGPQHKLEQWQLTLELAKV